MINHDKNSCVQCGKQMAYGLEGMPAFSFCLEPSCPAYGLLQFSIEFLATIKDKKDNL